MRPCIGASAKPRRDSRKQNEMIVEADPLMSKFLLSEISLRTQIALWRLQTPFDKRVSPDESESSQPLPFSPSLPVSLSPCLPVSLSPCLIFPGWQCKLGGLPRGPWGMDRCAAA